MSLLNSRANRRWMTFGVDLYIHRKKKLREFPVPSRDVTTKLSLGGNNDVITEFFPPRGSLVSDIPAGDGKLVNLFLRCSVVKVRCSSTVTCGNWVCVSGPPHPSQVVFLGWAGTCVSSISESSHLHIFGNI
jgi:hypothetical protein